MSSSESLSLKPERLSFHGFTSTLTAELTISIRNTEKNSNLLLNLTAIAGRRFRYRVIPSVFYLKPDEEIVVNVMRGRIMNGGPEGEWRDVLGIEAIRSTLPPQPYDPKHPLEAEESKELWAAAVRTGKRITSWLVPMEHDEVEKPLEKPAAASEPETPEPTASESETSQPTAGEPETHETTPNESETLETAASESGTSETTTACDSDSTVAETEDLEPWSRIEEPGNWFRFHSPGTYTKSYFSAMFWKPLEDRQVQECVIRLGDDEEEIHPVKMAMKWMVDSEGRVPAGDGTPRSLIGRALQEFRIWRELQHEHIAPLYGVVLWPNIGFLTPYYTNGRILKYIVDQNPPWSVRLRLMKEIASALCYLHSKSIVYGDLKEDNVLIDHNQHAKLIDFGLSMKMDDARKTPSFTGHIRYLAPEVADLRVKSDKSDIYAFGLLMLEIAVGRMAHDEQKADHLAAANAYYFPNLRPEHYPELRQSRSNVLWSLIVECTHRTPVPRPNILQVVKRLDQVSERDWLSL